MSRFFVDNDAVADGSVTIRGGDAFHIARALRLAVGDTVTVGFSDGTVRACRLSFIRDDEVRAEIGDPVASGESPLSITLYMGYPKGDKLETVTQKAVELGADAVVPFFSARTVKRPDAKGEEKARARLSRIAAEAAGQCGRGRVPTVGAVVSFSEMLKAAGTADLSLFCYEGAGGRELPKILADFPGVRTVAVIVGPEGGFSSEEAAAAADAGLNVTHLGTRILRCETAPLFVLSSLAFFYEL